MSDRVILESMTKEQLLACLEYKRKDVEETKGTQFGPSARQELDIIESYCRSIGLIPQVEFVPTTSFSEVSNLCYLPSDIKYKHGSLAKQSSSLTNPEVILYRPCYAKDDPKWGPENDVYGQYAQVRQHTKLELWMFVIKEWWIDEQPRIGWMLAFIFGTMFLLERLLN